MLKATIIGNLGADAEMRYSANGSPFLRFNVASNYRARTPEGEWQDRTEWVRVTALGQRAESLGQYLRKGTRVYVEGRLEARPWTDQQGQVRSGLEVIANANDVEFMSSRADDESRGGMGGGDLGGGSPPPPRDRSGPSGPPPRQAPQARQDPGDGEDLEDLPF